MTRTSNATWFPSKIDWWLALILVGAPLVSLVAGLGAPDDARLVTFSSALLIGALYLGLVFPMRYGVDDEHLTIRFGLVRKRIPLDDIREVRPTRNPLSSPALSLDRLRIDHGEGMFKSVMISPGDKQGFLSELAARANLRRNSDGLVR